MPTSRDVAQLAGVSQATVSYVLNGVRTKSISSEVQARVFQAAEELGYTIHPSARSLRTGKSEEIGIIVDQPASIQPTEVSLALHERAFTYGLTPVIYFSYGLPAPQSDALFQRIFARRPLGLIATGQSMTEARVALARKMGIEHIILITAQAVSYAHTLVLPVREVGYLAASHLLERGHTHIGMIRPEDPFTAYGFQQRLEGIRAALAEKNAGLLEILPMRLSQADAHMLVEQMLSRPNHPTAIYTYNDEYALPLLDALLDRGMSVPQDIAVLGTDDIAFSKLMRPALSTIRLDTGSIGQRAIDLLVTLSKKESLPAELTQPLIPQLIPRSST